MRPMLLIGMILDISSICLKPIEEYQAIIFAEYLES